jgi:hypothetical protein
MNISLDCRQYTINYAHKNEGYHLDGTQKRPVPDEYIWIQQIR